MGGNHKIQELIQTGGSQEGLISVAAASSRIVFIQLLRVVARWGEMAGKVKKQGCVYCGLWRGSAVCHDCPLFAHHHHG